MSQEVDGSIVIGSMGYNYNLLINGIYWDYKLLTNLLLTSWDIQEEKINVV